MSDTPETDVRRIFIHGDSNVEGYYVKASDYDAVKEALEIAMGAIFLYKKELRLHAQAIKAGK